MKAPVEATTRWTMRVTENVLVLENAGVLTLRSQMAGRDATADAVNAFKPCAVLVDLRKAVFLMSPADWRKMAEPEYWAQGKIPLPVAYIIPAAIEEQALDYCSAMSGHGLNRHPFTDFSEALAWCVWQATGRLPPTDP